MRICIVGCGAVGSLFAANLAQLDDVEVWAYDASREHVDAINTSGLRLSGAGDVLGRLRATADPGELPSCDFGIVATKAMHTGTAIRATAHAFADGCVATVQNGLGADAIVARHGDWKLLSAVTFMSGTRRDDTHVEYILDTATWIGPSRGAMLDDARAAAELIVGSGLQAEAFDDLRPAQWSKLIFNATVNTVAALTGLPHDPHFAAEDEPSDLGRLVHRLIDEGKAVAAAAGIELREDPWEMNVLATRRGSRHYPSMLADVEARRPTEVDLITGSLVAEAHRVGVPVPLHETMYRLIKAKEASWE
jgi:2-dehydropantoate 2-reductase